MSAFLCVLSGLSYMVWVAIILKQDFLGICVHGFDVV